MNRRKASVVAGGVDEIEHGITAEGWRERVRRSSGDTSARSGGSAAGSNHSTVKDCDDDIAERLTVKLPPFGAYTRYSAPTDGVCAKQ